MSWGRRWASAVRRLFRFRQAEQELDEEVRSCLEILEERYKRQGLAREEAARAARLEFEGPEQVKEKVREARTGAGVENAVRDLRYGARSLLHARGYAATVLLTVALCIAANTAIFAIVSSVLLRPLPFPGAERIVLMSNEYPKAGVDDLNASSVGDYYDRLEAVKALEDQALFRPVDLTVDMNGTAARMHGLAVTPSFFRLVQVQPARGRAFTAEEGEVGAHEKVILSDALWREMYAGDAGAAGGTLRVGGRPYTVVGVMPADFVFLRPDVRFWVPLAFSAEEKATHHSNNWHNAGRLKAGATRAQAQAQVDALNAANLERFPEMRETLINAGFRTVVTPLEEMLTRKVRGALYLLWGGAMVVLLMGALNLASISLARLTARRKEIATRLALGAGRARVLRQLIFETTMLTGGGGVCGVALGAGLLRILPAAGLAGFPRAGEVRVDGLAVAVALSLALAVGLSIGLMPLGGVLRMSVNGMLHESSRTGTSGRSSRRGQRALVGAEIGFAFVLLVGAGLLVGTVRSLMAADPGFATEGVLTVSMSAPQVKYPGGREMDDLMTRVLAASRRAPGVVAAGATTSIPFGGDYSDSVVLAEGVVMKPGDSVISPRHMAVTPGYFEAMNIAVVRGRAFDERDVETSQAVVVVDERVARHFWGDSDPVGRRMYQPTGPDDMGGSDAKRRWLTVVGVVRAVRMEDLTGAGNQMGAYYFPYRQRWSRSFTLAIRTAGSTGALERAVRAEMAGIEPQMPLFDMKTMAERAALSIAPRRTSMMLAVGFGVVALFLAAIGIYGVLAYLVAQRRREIGIRVALGSSGSGVVKLVLREGFTLLAGGVAAGLAGAGALRSVMASEIYGVGALEPLVLGGVVLLLGSIGMMACVLPARRALRVDPVTVLSEE